MARRLNAGRSLGATLVGFDLEPFYETARLLYEGPWVAERYLVIRNLAGFFARCDPSCDARDHRLPARGFPPPTPLPRCTGCRRCAALPSAPSPASTRWCCRPRRPLYSTAQVLANPIELNSRLGTYTNFVNLLDLCGLALPAAIRPDEIPFGITLLAPAGQDALLASIGRVFQAETKLTLGARAWRCRRLPTSPRLDGRRNRDRGGRCASFRDGAERRVEGVGRAADRGDLTAPDYRLYALDTTPPKPGMLRVEAGNGRIDRAGDLGAAGSGIRKIRCRDPAAAIDRHGAPEGRPRRQGLYGRSRRYRRRARYLRALAAGAPSWRRRQSCRRC